MHKITATSFAAKYKSKREVYNFLTVQVHAFLPPYHTLTIYFLKDLVSGKKKCKCNSLPSLMQHFVHRHSQYQAQASWYSYVWWVDSWENWYIHGWLSISLPIFPSQTGVSQVPKTMDYRCLLYYRRPRLWRLGHRLDRSSQRETSWRERPNDSDGSRSLWGILEIYSSIM